MGIKVFLGNAPWYKEGFYGVRAGSRWPHFESLDSSYMPFPFMLAYAAAVLEQRGINVLLVDGIAEKLNQEDFLAKITDYRPDLVVLEISSPSYKADRQITGLVREKTGPETFLAYCGLHAPMSEASYLDSVPDVDFVLRGEYEMTLADLAETLEQGGDPSRVPGLLLRDSQGRSTATPPRDIVQDVDSFPWPARHFLPMTDYNDNPGGMPDPVLQMWAGRGCPFSCTFCCWPHMFYNHTYRPRNIHDVLDEMDWAARKYGLKSVYFDDDTFNVGKKRMLSFCQAKIERNLRLPWSIMARADLMDREILENMVAAGLCGVKYGIESAEPRLIAQVNKKLDLEKARENIHISKSLGLVVHLTFMLGIPGETWETVRKTVRLARELSPHSVQFSLLTPMPGTRIYDELLEKGHLLSDDWDQYDGYFRSVIRTDELSSQDLEKALRYAWRSWILNHLRQNLSWDQTASFIRSLPRHLRHPRTCLSQVRRILYV